MRKAIDVTVKPAMKPTSPKTTRDTEDAKPAPLLEEVFAVEESPLLRYAYGYVKRREVAEEVVQEAFLKLHQVWDEVRQPRPWLYKAVRNIALNTLRKSNRETLTDQSELDQDLGNAKPDDQVGKLETVGAMRMLMAKLSEEDRALVRMKFEEEMTYSSISQALEIGVGNVGYRLHHVLKQLADGMRKLGVDGY